LLYISVEIIIDTLSTNSGCKSWKVDAEDNRDGNCLRSWYKNDWVCYKRESASRV